uniref:G-type lectin S-receptor-like serine/threonine-protein kinase At1g61360 n=1 Tax=Erigeron canadensis TaxID=72917 RepID=UPI001CB9B2FC|nr:G-type lectin S-receptor-like serine/threonine-protein kinase At1g61360 [Erigeron canadensis]
MVVAVDYQLCEREVKKLEHLRISLRDIQLATNDFSDTFKIRYHHLYYAYKTTLECVDREYLSSIEGKNIGELPKRRYTVKIMCVEYSEHLLSEIEIISSCKHHNIESFLGFCDEGPEMILVYEFISANHLQYNLENHNLTWGKRVKLCLDIAHGLNYLHDEMENQMTIIHGDLDSFKIELDDNMEGKIVGFGSAVFLTANQDEDTLGSEHAKTRESDVYSYGLLMIEILCGKFISMITSAEDDSSDDITPGQMDPTKILWILL